MTWYEIVFTVLAVLAVILGLLVLLGRHLQKKQASTMQMMEQNRQFISALIIDKKKMKLSDSTLPKSAQEQASWFVRIRKLPMIKVKAGPQLLTLLCDPTVYKNIPLKKVVKLEVSGAFVTGFSTAKKGEKKQEIPTKKLSLRERMKRKVDATDAEAKKAAAKKEAAKKEAARVMAGGGRKKK